MMNFRFYILLLISAHSFAQTSTVDSIKQKFTQFRNDNLQEKVYLHTSNDFYITGEHLWLKAYVVDCSLHKPVALSKVLYIELIDESNLAALQAKIALKEGVGEASLFIPATLQSGNYTLRAYTNWMKNFDAADFFHKSVTIVNTFQKPEPTAPRASKNSYHLEFFPEGGTLIEGIAGKVAFKISDSQGKGANLSGVVVNQQNDTVVTFAPHKFGIGHFYLTPEKGSSYKAILQEQDGKNLTFTLPVPDQNGLSIHLEDEAEEISITATSRNTEQQIPGVYLFIHTRNITSIAEFKYFSGNQAKFSIRKDKLPEGVSHITIFDSNLNPRCERLFFKPVTTLLNLSVSHAERFNTRAKVNLSIASRDALNQASESNLSIAVYKTDSLSHSTSPSIYEYFWLISDLRGNIEEPEYYFNNITDIVAADNLMLTHGWRKFKWDQILRSSKTEHVYLPEHNGHLVAGKLVSDSSEPLGGILTYLSSPDKVVDVSSGRTTADGSIVFQTKNIYGQRQLIFQTEHPSNFSFSFTNPFSEERGPQISKNFTLSRKNKETLLSRSIAMQVQNIYYEESAKLKRHVGDTLPFYNKPDQRYFLDDFTRFPVMEEVMREYVPGVMVRNRSDGFHFLVHNTVHQEVFREDPLVLLDGVPVSVDEIMRYDPRFVKRLDVITRKFYYGTLICKGIVSYSTYDGDLKGFQLDPKIPTINYEGLHQVREFYSPSYNDQNTRRSRLPDQRYLIYWNADVNTDENGNAETSFYTSDVTGDFIVVIEGLNKSGLSGRSISKFSVGEFSN